MTKHETEKPIRVRIVNANSWYEIGETFDVLQDETDKAYWILKGLFDYYDFNFCIAKTDAQILPDSLPKVEEGMTAEKFLILRGCQRMTLEDNEKSDFFEDVQPKDLEAFAQLRLSEQQKEMEEKLNKKHSEMLDKIQDERRDYIRVNSEKQNLEKEISELQSRLTAYEQREKAMPSDEDLTNYFFFKCKNCDWFGLSNEMNGGNQIGDTGDYFDAECPICACKEEKEYEEIEIAKWMRDQMNAGDGEKVAVEKYPIEFDYWKTGTIGVCAVGIKGKPFVQMMYWDGQVIKINIYEDRDPSRWLEYRRDELPIKIALLLEKSLIQFLTDKNKSKELFKSFLLQKKK